MLKREERSNNLIGGWKDSPIINKRYEERDGGGQMEAPPVLYSEGRSSPQRHAKGPRHCPGHQGAASPPRGKQLPQQRPGSDVNSLEGGKQSVVLSIVVFSTW